MSCEKMIVEVESGEECSDKAQGYPTNSTTTDAGDECCVRAGALCCALRCHQRKMINIHEKRTCLIW